MTAGLPPSSASPPSQSASLTESETASLVSALQERVVAFCRVLSACPAGGGGPTLVAEVKKAGGKVVVPVVDLLDAMVRRVREWEAAAKNENMRQV